MHLKHKSTKRYDHDEGFSCVFRQWRATHSHCSTLHGYALAIELVFGANELDERNWVYDFGGLKPVKQYLTWLLDHTHVAAEDDPHLETFKELHEKGLTDLRILPDIGCEKFAEHIFHAALRLLDLNIINDRVKLESVRVWEHGGNSAIYVNPTLALEDRQAAWIGDLHSIIQENPHVIPPIDLAIVLEPTQWLEDIAHAIEPAVALVVDYAVTEDDGQLEEIINGGPIVRSE